MLCFNLKQLFDHPCLCCTQPQGDILAAIENGADGIGMLRTEAMFLNPESIDLFRKLILSAPSDAQRSCVSALISSQMHEFLEMFRLTRNRRVCVRLLDSPLDIFFPQVGTLLFESEMLELSKRLDMDSVKCLRRVQFIQDNNPSTGLRGCRISILYPEVTVIQVKALLGLWVYRSYTIFICRFINPIELNSLALNSCTVVVNARRCLSGA